MAVQAVGPCSSLLAQLAPNVRKVDVGSCPGYSAWGSKHMVWAGHGALRMSVAAAPHRPARHPKAGGVPAAHM